jgi:hypothetical protein
MRQIANHLIDVLEKQPLALALVVINLLFLIAFFWMLREIDQAVERRDVMIERCIK